MKFIIVFFLFLSHSIVAQAEDSAGKANSATQKSNRIPTSVHISYTITTGIGQGELKEVVDISQKSDEHTFHITSDAQATGVFKIIKPGHIVRNSRGLVTKQGLRPSYYSDQRAERAPSLALFDWENKVLTLKHKNRETQEPLIEGTQDRLSLSYHFIFIPDIAEKAEAQLGKLIEVYVADGRTLQLMQFTVSKEKLNTPLGRLDTYVLTKLHDHDNPMQRKMWLAPRYHMIPVRIQSVEKDGLEVEKMIAEVSFGYDEHIDSCCKH